MEYTTWGDFRGKVTEVTVKKEKIEIDPKSNFTRMEWTLAPNEVVMSPEFYKDSGSDVWISFLVEPRDVNVRGGIIEANGERRYIEDKEELWNVFILREGGSYRMFVENVSDFSIQIYGFYE